MAHCERCELDDSYCAHSPSGLRALHPLKARRTNNGATRTSNRDWCGEVLTTQDYARAPQHRNWRTDVQIENVWSVYLDCCLDCEREGRSHVAADDPALPGLRGFSNVALCATASRISELYPCGTPVPTLSDWLTLLRQHQAAALAHGLVLRDGDVVARDQMRSGRQSSWRMGRSPGYYSR